MAIDCTSFIKINVVDTCAIWNILSSRKMTLATKAAHCHFTATTFVYYEALYKLRTVLTREDKELQDRLREERTRENFGNCELEIADLQEVDILEQRMRLGKGELSSIAFAKKARMGFMTDDQKARKLGATVIGENRVQTTPQLFGWLFFDGHLVDADKDTVIREHEEYDRPLRRYFEEMYNEAMMRRLMART